MSVQEPGASPDGPRYNPRERFEPPPIARLLGFDTPTRMAQGEAVIPMQVDGRHANPMGTVHGGVLCDLADAAMGMALATTLAEGESFTTLELKINFLKPVWEARLEARGRIVKKGRSTALLEADLTDAGGSLVARASSTCMILRGEQAAGR